MKPYEFNRIKYLTFDLVNVYHSVNDKSTQEAVFAQVEAEILSLSNGSEVQEFLSNLTHPKITTEQAEKLLSNLKNLVEPFELPKLETTKKIFKKVKKLQFPSVENWDFRDISYFAWNEVASQRKYILLENQGFYGQMYGHKKNICAICQKTSEVTQFRAITRQKADGTYTSRGNWICIDSEQCNRQMQQIYGLTKFVEQIKEQK